MNCLPCGLIRKKNYPCYFPFLIFLKIIIITNIIYTHMYTHFVDFFTPKTTHVVHLIKGDLQVQSTLLVEREWGAK
jgi:hypothetical protein